MNGIVIKIFTPLFIPLIWGLILLSRWLGKAAAMNTLRLITWRKGRTQPIHGPQTPEEAREILRNATHDEYHAYVKWTLFWQMPMAFLLGTGFFWLIFRGIDLLRNRQRAYPTFVLFIWGAIFFLLVLAFSCMELRKMKKQDQETMNNILFRREGEEKTISRAWDHVYAFDQYVEKKYRWTRRKDHLS